MRIALWLHVLGVVVWVGGMFFVQMALRPAAMALEPPQRLMLLARTLRHFFPWVGVAVIAIVASGFAMIVQTGGFARLPASVHIMTAIGLVMAAIFVWIALVPFRTLLKAVSDGAWPAGGAAMNSIRRLVAFNLILGIVTITIAILGRAM